MDSGNHVLYLIRHGATKGNLEHRYVGATEEGILPGAEEGLRELGERLPEMDHIFTSPALRCRQSAEVLFPYEGGHGVGPDIITDFRELDFGKFEYKNYQELNGDPDYQRYIDSGGIIGFPRGEDPEQFKQRCRRAFVSCADKVIQNRWENTAFVIHGGTMMAVMEAYALPGKSYFDYQVRNGCGFCVSLYREETGKGMGEGIWLADIKLLCNGKGEME